MKVSLTRALRVTPAGAMGLPLAAGSVPAEQLVSIDFVQGGSGGQLRGDVENAIRQAIIE